jgi:N-acetylglucosamine kinase-like BadF-type ATPase
MEQKTAEAGAGYFLGFDGGGSKTECVLADEKGRVLARATGGPSNPVRSGYAKAWFSLGEVADVVLCHERLTSNDIRGICAGIGGAGRDGVASRLQSFFERSYRNATVRVITDLEIALEAAFGEGEGILLVAGTGSAAFGRDANGHIARAGGRGPWFSDEGSAFDIGRRAFSAIVRAQEHRGPATTLTDRILSWHKFHSWDTLLDQIVKDADVVFPKTFPLVAQLAERDDAVARTLLIDAAVSLAALAASAVSQLGWEERNVPLALVGGMYGRSKFFDAAIDSELRKALPRLQLVPVQITPGEAAARMALRTPVAEGNAA